MKSGLEDRNNIAKFVHHTVHDDVSMKSGLEDRNNQPIRNVMVRPLVSQ